MLPSYSHVLLCEQHRRKMLTEAERQRLIRQLPRQKRPGLKKIILQMLCAIGIRASGLAAKWGKKRRTVCNLRG